MIDTSGLKRFGGVPVFIGLIGLTVCIIGVSVGVALDPVITLASVLGVIGLVVLMSISKRQPEWILIAVLFGIQAGIVWLPEWKGRHLLLSGSDIGITVLAASLLAQILTRRWTPHRSPLDLSWAVFLFTLLPSLWFTKDLLWWIAGMRQILQGLVMFYLVYEMIETFPQARKLGLLLVAWGSVAAITLIYNIYFSSEGYLFTLVHKETDVTWARSNYFASFMLLVIPVAVFMAIYEKNKIIWFSLNLAAAVMAVAIVITRSTGAAVVAIICATLWVLVVRRGQMLKLFGWLALIGGVIVGGSYLFSTVAAHTIDELPLVFQNFWQTDKAQTRLLIWTYNIGLFWQSPWVGNGLLNTFLYIPKNRFGSEAQLLEPHNYIIQMLSQTGIVGLFGFVTLWWHTGLELVKNWRATTEGTWQRGLLTGSILGVVAGMLHGLIEPNILEKDFGMVLWAMIGLAFALGRTLVRERTKKAATKG